VLAESALELIPASIHKSQDVIRDAKRRRKPPSQLLLDRTRHHAAMSNVRHAWRRGRPDIVHVFLSEVLGTPLNKEGRLRVYVHTFNDSVIQVDPKIRIPRSYNLFVGLMEQLFQHGTVPLTGPPLMRIRSETLPQLIRRLGGDYTLAFSRSGTPKTMEQAARGISGFDNPVAVIGGFPRGHFSEKASTQFDELVSIDAESLWSSVVASRLVYEYERAIGLPESRLNLSPTAGGRTRL